MMFQLDENFLNDVGLGEMPAEQKSAFLQHIYQELEVRVGTKLSEGLSEDQLSEFEKIVDKDQPTVDGWLADNIPEFKSDEIFGRLKQSTKLDENDPNLRAEYVATKWLEVNRPDYRQVVAMTLDELKKEIAGQKDALLDAS